MFVNPAMLAAMVTAAKQKVDTDPVGQKPIDDKNLATPAAPEIAAPPDSTPEQGCPPEVPQLIQGTAQDEVRGQLRTILAKPDLIEQQNDLAALQDDLVRKTVAQQAMTALNSSGYFAPLAADPEHFKTYCDQLYGDVSLMSKVESQVKRDLAILTTEVNHERLQSVEKIPHHVSAQLHTNAEAARTKAHEKTQDFCKQFDATQVTVDQVDQSAAAVMRAEGCDPDKIAQRGAVGEKKSVFARTIHRRAAAAEHVREQAQQCRLPVMETSEFQQRALEKAGQVMGTINVPPELHQKALKAAYTEIKSQGGRMDSAALGEVYWRYVFDHYQEYSQDQAVSAACAMNHDDCCKTGEALQEYVAAVDDVHLAMTDYCTEVFFEFYLFIFDLKIELENERMENDRIADQKRAEIAEDENRRVAMASIERSRDIQTRVVQSAAKKATLKTHHKLVQHVRRVEHKRVDDNRVFKGDREKDSFAKQESLQTGEERDLLKRLGLLA